jgi:hypothetical protein
MEFWATRAAELGGRAAKSNLYRGKPIGIEVNAARLIGIES